MEEKKAKIKEVYLILITKKKPIEIEIKKENQFELLLNI